MYTWFLSGLIQARTKQDLTRATSIDNPKAGQFCVLIADDVEIL